MCSDHEASGPQLGSISKFDIASQNCNLSLSILRMQILATRGLAPKDFNTGEEANIAADLLVKDFHHKYPAKKALHPDIIFAGQPMLDQFWFAEHNGT